VIALEDVLKFDGQSRIVAYDREAENA